MAGHHLRTFDALMSSPERDLGRAALDFQQVRNRRMVELDVAVQDRCVGQANAELASDPLAIGFYGISVLNSVGKVSMMISAYWHWELPLTAPTALAGAVRAFFVSRFFSHKP